MSGVLRASLMLCPVPVEGSRGRYPPTRPAWVSSLAGKRWRPVYLDRIRHPLGRYPEGCQTPADGARPSRFAVGHAESRPAAQGGDPNSHALWAAAQVKRRRSSSVFEGLPNFAVLQTFAEIDDGHPNVFATLLGSIQ